MNDKKVKPMRYSYAVTSALLAGGAALSLFAGFPAGAQSAQNEGQNLSQIVPRAGAPASFADLTETLQPAVVNIATKQRIASNGRGGGSREGQSQGSGFLISADGYVVTNNHVVQSAGRSTLEEVTVTTPDGTKYDAVVVGTDADSDLAVLKITRAEPFPFVHFGDSAAARAGDWVIAIGNPFGLGGTVTSGIVSKARRNAGGGAYARYIQTDASINSGNSGGPLFDMQGNVIGINNAIISPSGGSVGIGFAIPADTASPIVDKLISGEEIARGFLGIGLAPVSEDIADALGIPENRGEFVRSVRAGTPAAAAGLKADDVILKIDGQEITPDETLSFLVANIDPGTQVPIEFLRAGEMRAVNITVGKRPSAAEFAAQNFDPDEEQEEITPDSGDGSLAETLGVLAQTIEPEIARRLGMDTDATGVVVTAVDRNSDAARKGITRGIVILQANGTDLTSVADLEAAVSDARDAGREAMLLRLRLRDGQIVSAAIRLKD